MYIGKKLYAERTTDIPFLGSLAKLRKATISFVMSVLLSVCSSLWMEQIGCHWTDFHKIWYFSVFRNYVENSQVSLKSGKN